MSTFCNRHIFLIINYNLPLHISVQKAMTVQTRNAAGFSDDRKRFAVKSEHNTMLNCNCSVLCAEGCSLVCKNNSPNLGEKLQKPSCIPSRDDLRQYAYEGDGSTPGSLSSCCSGNANSYY